MIDFITQCGRYIKHGLLRNHPKWVRMNDGHGPWTVEYRGRRVTYHVVEMVDFYPDPRADSIGDGFCQPVEIVSVKDVVKQYGK